MKNKILASLILTLFGVALFVSEPLNLKEVRADVIYPATSQVIRAIHGNIKVISAPVSGVKVKLFAKFAGEKVKLVGETTTDKNGSYSFKRLQEGHYLVVPKDRSFVFTPEMVKIDFTDCEVRCIETANFEASSR